MTDMSAKSKTKTKADARIELFAKMFSTPGADTKVEVVPRAKFMPSCAFCDKKGITAVLGKCSGCSEVVYCSEDHRSQHWPIHRAACIQSASYRMASSEQKKKETEVELMDVLLALESTLADHASMFRKDLKIHQVVGFKNDVYYVLEMLKKDSNVASANRVYDSLVTQLPNADDFWGFVMTGQDAVINSVLAAYLDLFMHARSGAVMYNGKVVSSFCLMRSEIGDAYFTRRRLFCYPEKFPADPDDFNGELVDCVHTQSHFVVIAKLADKTSIIIDPTSSQYDLKERDLITLKQRQTRKQMPFLLRPFNSQPYFTPAIDEKAIFTPVSDIQTRIAESVGATKTNDKESLVMKDLFRALCGAGQDFETPVTFIPAPIKQ